MLVMSLNYFRPQVQPYPNDEPSRGNGARNGHYKTYIKTTDDGQYMEYMIWKRNCERKQQPARAAKDLKGHARITTY